MSKGREVIITRALSSDECSSAEAFSLEEMIGSKGSFNVLQPRDTPPDDVLVEDVSEDEIAGKLTAEQLETIQKQAYQEAYDKGLAEGIAAGQAQAVAEGRQQSIQLATQFDNVLAGFVEPIQVLDDAIMDELTSMVMTVAKHLIHRELKSEPGQIIAVIREVLAALPMNSRQIKLYLNPVDASLVRETLIISSEDDASWKIIEDPTLSRGGLKVISENSHIDATIESRLGEIVARVLGSQREPSSE